MLEIINNSGAVNFFTNLALFVLGIEILAILALGSRIGLPRRFLPNALAGFFILVALRLSLNNSAGVLVVGSLFLSLLSHAADLWSRKTRN